MSGRLFELRRDVDVSGVSGTGTVADGVEFPDGTCVIRWRGERRSTVVWRSIEAVEAIHGHGGATSVVWVDGVAVPVPPLGLPPVPSEWIDTTARDFDPEED